MSQDQQAMTGTTATDSIAADMPSVPGAETAKGIIENAVHPHGGTATPSGSTAQATPMSATSQGAPPIASASLQTPVAGGAMSQQPASGMGGTAATAFTDQIIDVPIMGESLTFAKRAVVTEEVRLYKRSSTEQKSVTDTIRRERVTVEGADVVEGDDSQITTPGVRGAQGEQEGAPGVQGALQGGAQNVQESAGEAKHGLDGLIDGAVDKLFGGHHQ